MEILVKDLKVFSTFNEELFKEILRAVPFVRTKLIHAAIAEGRTAILDRVVPVLLSEVGVDATASVLHGCSYVTTVFAAYF